MSRCVNELLTMQIPDEGADPHSLDIYIDMVRVLKQLGRNPEAATLFAPRYARLKDDLDKSPRAPDKMNNRAWRCARCGEHADEAYRLASEAVKLTSLGDREYSENLDTAAEAAAASRKWDIAIQNETMALKLMPEDLFMRSQ